MLGEREGEREREEWKGSLLLNKFLDSGVGLKRFKMREGSPWCSSCIQGNFKLNNIYDTSSMYMCLEVLAYIHQMGQK